MVNRLLGILAILLVFSCDTKTFDSQEDLTNFLKNDDHGYLKRKKSNGVTFELIYKPTDLLVAQDLENIGHVDSLRTMYSKYLYFTLSMSVNEQEILSQSVSDKQKYGKELTQLLFQMNDNIHLFNEKRDTIVMLDYVYPRMYGMSNKTTLLLVYPRNEIIKKSNSVNLTIEDLGFQTGETRFTFDINKLINEPKLKFN